ncbi:GNAT family N-acetyltransferase [Aggregatilinea lenta]|uniref:GNAT family N-acetyltransferase n=1 Tax=Aggregatilinea lenta TaxID=913108 RepID=UPI0013C2CA72|nr:GNAT family N-acetyltransferase [Aggregatilinea lenta]
MTDPISVRKVESKSDLDVFLKFPWTVYRDNAYWVPPLMSMQRHKFDKAKNPTWEHLEGDYFIAWRGDRPVGTVAAFVNHRHNEYHHEHIGFFGAFEVYDDQEAATALLDTAADYVRALGYDALRGPATFSTNEECGIMIEGFDDPPVVLMPYNPPYYQRLVEATPGFERVMDLYSYYITFQAINNSPKLEKLFRITQQNSKRRSIIIRTPDTKHLDHEFQLLKDIYNLAWDENWGYVPFSSKELDEMVKDLGQYFEPRLTFFAEIEGKPVAFMLALPDLNQVLLKAYPRPGKLELVTLLQLLWHWKVRSKITRIRIMLMGVEEGHRGIGIESAMFVEAYKAAQALGWEVGDGGWVLETNEPMQRLVEAYNSVIYKRYRFYELPLKPGYVVQAPPQP